MHTTLRPLLAASALLSLAAAPALAGPDVQFESPAVHPVELSADGTRLYVAHAADHRLVVFGLESNTPHRIAEVMVGLDPVTVRERGPGELWVVNHLSDDISVVDVASGHVVRTIQVGDEPTDLVFAGNPERAFVLLSQEDALLVLDPAAPDAPGTRVPLEASDPRALALSPDGSKIYVAALEGGNRTTAIPFEVVDAMGGPPAPDPPMSPGLPQPPRTALIVQHDGTNWVDEAGGVWDAAVPYEVLDHDVLRVDVASLAVDAVYSDVGTSMFSVAVNPVTGELAVGAQEVDNLTRFEPKLKGDFARSRVSFVVPSSGAVQAVHLNPHIDYGVEVGSAGERALSLSTPIDLAFRSDGSELFVAAFANARVGVLDALGSVQRRIDVAGGPAGLALDEARNRLYVYGRFASVLSVVDLSDDSRVDLSLGFDPTPADIAEGRRVFYDAVESSAHGDVSCASCHLFGGLDNLAWDLGDPTGEMQPSGSPLVADYHPMKGPMTTQSLKGLQGTQPLHWRGDRANLVDFNPAFVGLLGRAAELDPGMFAQFNAFVMSLAYPPNPNRQLDGSYPVSFEGGNPATGEQLFLNGQLVGNLECVDCHALPTGENGLLVPGSALAEDEGKVVPQLRNMYEKTRFDDTQAQTLRGFGFIHDGSVDDLLTFLEFPAFTFRNQQERVDVAAFLHCFDTGTHPATGAQITLRQAADGSSPRLATLVAMADAGHVELVAKGNPQAADVAGWSYQGGGQWLPDVGDEVLVGTADLAALAGPGSEITVTGVPLGCGHRLGVDRDGDGHLDGDERLAQTDPGNPDSFPGGPVTGNPGGIAATTQLWMAGANPVRGRGELAFRLPAPGLVRLELYDLRGRHVRQLMAGEEEAGVHRVAWDLRDDRGRAVTAGIYFARLEAGGELRQLRVAVAP